MQILNESYFRSEGRNVNQDDDLVKVNLIMSIYEWRELKNRYTIESMGSKKTN